MDKCLRQRFHQFEYLKLLIHYLRLLKKKKKKKDLQKCSTSEMSIDTLTSWFVLLYHELQHRWGVARRRSACGTAEVLLKPFRSPYFWVGCFSSSFFLTPLILYGVQVSPVGWPIKNVNIMVSKAFGINFGPVSRCQVLWEKEICISTSSLADSK